LNLLPEALLLDFGSNTKHILFTREISVLLRERVGLGRLSKDGLPESRFWHGRW